MGKIADFWNQVTQRSYSVKVKQAGILMDLAILAKVPDAIQTTSCLMSKTISTKPSQAFSFVNSLLDMTMRSMNINTLSLVWSLRSEDISRKQDVLYITKYDNYKQK